MPNILVTSFDSAYFKAGLTLISAIHRTSYEVVDRVLVYDLGLTTEQRRFLGRCEKVEVLPYPDIVRTFFDGYLEPGQFAWKPCAIKHAGAYGTHVFWLDAGAMPVKSLAEIYEKIDREDIFLVQDENLTARWTHARAFQLMHATDEERNGRLLCAGIQGYKVGGKYQPLVDQAYEYSQNPEIVRGPRDSHRHDQSIYSVLAIRHKCPVNSLERFGEFRCHDRRPDQVIYVHRGGYHLTSGLRLQHRKALSVCLCTFNAKRTLVRVIRSLKLQRDVQSSEWEVIVVDNNSIDGTMQEAEGLRGELSCDVRLTREPVQGLFFARRKGTLEAEGRVVVFLDDDLLLGDRWVRLAIDFFASHDQVGLVGGRIEEEVEGGCSGSWDEVKWMYGVRDLGPIPINLSSRPGVLEHAYGGGTAVRGAAAQEAYLTERFYLSGRSGDRLSSGEDIELAWHIVNRGWESWYQPGLISTHLIPRWRLDAEYLLELKAGIADGCIAMESLKDRGFYPLGRRMALKKFWWAVLCWVRNLPRLLHLDMGSRLESAGRIGRLRGTWRQVVASFRVYGWRAWRA